MRVVLDTNVLLPGLMYPDSVPGRVVAAWRQSRFEPVMSTEQLSEVARVLAYPKIARRLQWRTEEIRRFLKQLYLRCEMVELSGEEGISVPADPDDSPILASLVVAEADYLISGDRDLLAFRDRHPVLKPAEFAEQLNG